MAHDQHTYRRGRNAALLGGFVQAVLALAVIILGMWAENKGVITAGMHLLGGLPVWIILWLIYQQHCLERVEALESEQLSHKDRAAAAMFADHADDLDLARRRLDKLYKWGLSAVSLLLSAYLIGLGLYEFMAERSVRAAMAAAEAEGAIFRVRPVGEHVSVMVLIGATVGVAFVAFAAARYLSGMTQVRQWQLLRGGAGYLMGNFVVMLLLLVGSIAMAFDSYIILRLSSYIVPGLMVLIGLEVLLTFLLGAYRPRRAGEVPRPAFDSRVLGLMTSPQSLGKIISDTINYQFGFEITRSWFYQLLGKAITPLVVFAIVIMLLLSTLVFVRPYEQAVITVNGRIARIAEPGLSLKWPWPIARAERFEVGKVHELSVGSGQHEGETSVLEEQPDDGHGHGRKQLKVATETKAAILWTDKHTVGGEEYLMTAPTRTAATQDREATGDEGVSLLAGEMLLQYRIRRGEGLRQYVKAVHRARESDDLLAAVANRHIASYYRAHDVETILGHGRHAAGDLLREAIQRDLDDLKLGLEVLFVGLTAVHPPQEKGVAANFQRMLEADLERDTEIERAEKQAIQSLATAAGSSEHALLIDAAIQELQAIEDQLNDLADDAPQRDALEGQIKTKLVDIDALLASASGTVATMIYQARAYRWLRAITERAEADRFAAELKAYNNAPDYYLARRRLEALALALADVRKIVIGAGVSAAVDYQMKKGRTLLTDMFIDSER
jgi:membrane protease subunit HflK